MVAELPVRGALRSHCFTSLSEIQPPNDCTIIRLYTTRASAQTKSPIKGMMLSMLLDHLFEVSPTETETEEASREENDCAKDDASEETYIGDAVGEDTENNSG